MRFIGVVPPSEDVDDENVRGARWRCGHPGGKWLVNVRADALQRETARADVSGERSNCTRHGTGVHRGRRLASRWHQTHAPAAKDNGVDGLPWTPDTWRALPMRSRRTNARVRGPPYPTGVRPAGRLVRSCSSCPPGRDPARCAGQAAERPGDRMPTWSRREPPPADPGNAT